MEWMVVKTYQSKSPLVVGADGYHSFVRQNLGIEFNRMAELSRELGARLSRIGDERIFIDEIPESTTTGKYRDR